MAGHREGTPPGPGTFWGVCVATPTHRALVYPMAVVGDWATRDAVGECCMGWVACIVPELLFPPAFRARHPHQCLPPTGGGAVQWRSCCSPCFSHLPVTKPGCPIAGATPDGTMACKQSAWRRTHLEEGLAGEGRHGTCLSLGSRAGLQLPWTWSHSPPRGAATSTLRTLCG